jgi:hypothetical protein
VLSGVTGLLRLGALWSGLTGALSGAGTGALSGAVSGAASDAGSAADALSDAVAGEVSPPRRRYDIKDSNASIVATGGRALTSHVGTACGLLVITFPPIVNTAATTISMTASFGSFAPHRCASTMLTLAAAISGSASAASR